MTPAASVSGVYFAHPESRYFAVGRLGATRSTTTRGARALALAEAERWLRPNLGYEVAVEVVR